MSPLPQNPGPGGLVPPSAVPCTAAAARFAHVGFLGASGPGHAGRPSMRKPGTARSSAGLRLDPESIAFFEALCTSRGLDAGRYRHTILARRQAACLRALRASTLAEGTLAIDRDGERVQRAIGAILIGVTGFFRDPPVFQALRPLLAPLYHERMGLRAMSMACSDGSELYSLAMLLAAAGVLPGSRLLGVDCRADAIAAAAEGLYRAELVEAIPAELRQRYCEPAGVTWSPGSRDRSPRPMVRMAPTLRAVCRWETGDVFQQHADDPKRHPMDLILCRNLAIYLTPDAAAQLWSTLCARLRVGGLLVVGKAERPCGPASGWLAREGPCIFRKTREVS